MKRDKQSNDQIPRISAASVRIYKTGRFGDLFKAVSVLCECAIIEKNNEKQRSKLLWTHTELYYVAVH